MFCSGIVTNRQGFKPAEEMPVDVLIIKKSNTHLGDVHTGIPPCIRGYSQFCFVAFAGIDMEQLKQGHDSLNSLDRVEIIPYLLIPLLVTFLLETSQPLPPMGSWELWNPKENRPNGPFLKKNPSKISVPSAPGPFNGF